MIDETASRIERYRQQLIDADLYTGDTIEELAAVSGSGDNINDVVCIEYIRHMVAQHNQSRGEQ